MPITDEELIAYLLGDAAAEVKQRIEHAIVDDPSIVERLAHLRFTLGQIDSLTSVYEAPSDLIASTLARIDGCAAEGQSSAADKPVGVALGVAQPIPNSNSSWWDSSVLSLCVAALCCLILPAVVRARYEARRIQCAQNMKQIGQDLQNYAELDPGGRFPRVAVDGPEAFSGVFVVRLADAGMPVPMHRVQCPSLIGMPSAYSCAPPPMVSNRNQLYQLTPEELRSYQQSAGGDLAYSLGVLEDGRVMAPRFDGRSQFAIVADAPMIQGGREQFVAHEGRGINIFFEDGRVIFFTGDLAQPEAASFLHDDPFRNMENTHEVGLTNDDASLAPSYFPPLSR